MWLSLQVSIRLKMMAARTELDPPAATDSFNSDLLCYRKSGFPVLGLAGVAPGSRTEHHHTRLLTKLMTPGVSKSLTRSALATSLPTTFLHHLLPW